MVLLPLKEGETEESRAAYLAPLRQALIDQNERHVNVVVSESDDRALKRGIEYLPAPLQ
jgi:hypothetical protein